MLVAETFGVWAMVAVYAALFVGAMVRGQVIYWLARLLTDRVMDSDAPGAGWRPRVHRGTAATPDAQLS